jgi:hypothetical protein
MTKQAIEWYRIKITI